jgi:tRNA(fMet)-specific endonuclease VapC
MILLDTDVCIELLRGNGSVIEKRKTSEQEIAISFMTMAELYYGAYKSANSPKNLGLVEEFLLSVRVLQTNQEIMRQFGELKANLELGGKGLADADLLIAATCLQTCDFLVTGNIKHYQRIENLRLENWIR